MMLIKRRFLAAIVAPLVGVTVACLGFVATGAVLGSDLSVSSWLGVFEHWLGFHLFFGLPLAYLAQAFALALYRAKYPSEPPRLWVTTTVAASLGGLLVFGVWASIFGATFGLTILPSGLIGGAVAGIVYWATGARSAQHAPASRSR